MYIIGQAYDPKIELDASCWSIEIHNIMEDESGTRSHWACIMIYAATMDLCLLKAKIICDTLNTKRYVNAEMMVEKLCATKDQQPVI